MKWYSILDQDIKYIQENQNCCQVKAHNRNWENHKTKTLEECKEKKFFHYRPKQTMIFMFRTVFSSIFSVYCFELNDYPHVQQQYLQANQIFSLFCWKLDRCGWYEAHNVIKHHKNRVKKLVFILSTAITTSKKVSIYSIRFIDSKDFSSFVIQQYK